MTERLTIDEEKLLLLQEYQKTLARENLWAFLNYVNPEYSRQWYHTYIANRCQQLLSGELATNGLMIFIPPQHGKSEIISRQFPAWALGQNPRLKIVGCSYSASLAQQFSRSIQRLIDTESYRSLFPETRLNGMNVATDSRRGWLRNIDIFETVRYGGYYKAVGVGGSLTGTAVDIGIIDDPIKDALQAYSDIYRERVWDWYISVFLTRLHNKSKQILIMTRWHDDDLAGRLLKREPGKWTVVSIPAVCEIESDGEIGSSRRVGEALWEARHSAERLREIEKRSPSVFAALYQQRPVIEGGNIIKEAWFRRISAADFKALRFREVIHFYVDTAYNERKSNTDNDPTGILAACRIGNAVYIVDAQKVYKEMPELLKFLPDYAYAHGYTDESELHIEPKANGESVVQMFERYSTLNVVRTPIPKDSKVVRIKAVSPRIECGRVYIVEGSWNDEFITEVCAFPNAPHDEYVDILGYAVNDLFKDSNDNDFEYLDKAMFGIY